MRRPVSLRVAVVAIVALLAPVAPAAATGGCVGGDLQQVIDDAPAGSLVGVIGTFCGTVVIDKDLDISGGFYEAVLDGDGAGPLITIAPGAAVSLTGFTLEDGAAEDGAAILNHGDLYAYDTIASDSQAISSSGGVIHNMPGGTLWLREVWVTDNQGNGVVNEGVMDLDDSWIQRNQGRGVIALAGDTAITGTEISSNGSIERPGGGIAALGGAVAVTGVRAFGNAGSDPGAAMTVEAGAHPVAINWLAATDNVTRRRGGALHLGPDATVVIEGGEFRNNSANTGGAVYADFGSSLEATDLTIDHNVASPGAGGAMFIIGASVHLTESIVSNNSGLTGGGFSISSRSDVMLADVKFVSNRAGWEGGAIHNYQSDLEIRRSVLYGNSARDGGAVSSSNEGDPRSDLGMFDVTVHRNTAERWGGGVYIVAGDATIKRITVLENSAGEAGGGLYNKRGSVQTDTKIENSTFQHNTAPTGAAIANHYATISIGWTTITENQGDSAVAWSPYGVRKVGASIISGNDGVDCDGTVTSTGWNVTGPSCGLSGTGDVTTDDPGLQRMPRLPWYEPLPDSPALDLVPSGTCPSIDQIGTPRPQGAACEAGSIEAPNITS